MAARARSEASVEPAVAPSGTGVGRLASPAAVSGDEAPIASPAQQLQDALAAEFAAPQEKKWPPVVGLAIVVGTGLGFWGLVGLALSGL